MTAPAPLAGVIGDPIGHSKSPRLHGHWLAQLGVPGHYIPIHVRPDHLVNALDGLRALGFAGVNVTIPHKEQVLAHADQVTDAARSIGAANTLTFDAAGQLHADNTDAYGFLQNLRDHDPDLSCAKGPVAILGAGGASRAVIWALLDAGCPELRLANRTEDRAQALARRFGPRVKVVPVDRPDQLWSDASLAVNATSLGMATTQAVPFDLSGLPDTALATDLIYTPLDTAFLQAARAKGCATVDGLGMLLHQAVPGFERWFGQRPQVTDALRQVVLAP